MCPMIKKCGDLFVAGVICFYCTLGFRCEHKKNEFAEVFSHEVPRDEYIPQPTKESVTVVASASNPLTSAGGTLLITTKPDPIIKGNQLHYFSIKLTSDEKEKSPK